MKHLSFILVLLLVSVITTACINNLAIQELNNNAKSYIDKGDTDSAICRLKSSLELDSQVFETHYNLGIAYLTAKLYDDAAKEFRAAIDINPDYVDAYYSLAIALEESAFDIENKYFEVDEDDLDEKTDAKEQKVLDENTKKKIIERLNEAVEAYENYVSIAKDAKETAKIKEKIENIQQTVDEKYIQGKTSVLVGE